MRIGELLEVQINDIVLSDRKILIYLGSKNYQGRAVYFSEDAEHALKHWLRIRDSQKRYLFYGTPGERLSYSTAWGVMRKTLERAGHTAFTACVTPSPQIWSMLECALKCYSNSWATNLLK